MVSRIRERGRVVGIFFRRHWFGVLLYTVQFTAFSFALWYIPYRHLPLPGVAVAIIAVLAAVMSIHPKIGPWQKVGYLLLIGAFLVTELRAIRKDRKDATTQADTDRGSQDTKFEAIRKAQDDEFKVTARGLSTAIKGLDTAISGIKSTLIASNTTIKQTRPEAYVVMDGWQFAQSMKQTWGMGLRFIVDFKFKNIGLYTATNIYKFGKFYLVENDGLGVEKAYLAFQDDYKKGRQGPSMLVRDDERLSLDEEPGFSVSDMKDVQSEKKQIVAFFRVEYSDKFGRWQGDFCRALNPVANTRDLTGIEEEVQCHDYHGIEFNNPRHISKPQ